MIDHDKVVGALLDHLDELGIAENTIVVYSTDNGPHMNSWPDGAMTPFRNEKNSNWEGAYRVPELIRWPGTIPAGVVSNEIIAHQDWLPTFLAAAGEPDIAAKLKEGYQAGAKTFNVHLDGYNLLPYLTGKEADSPRNGFFYFSDDGDLVAMRYDHWKLVFLEQRVPGTLRIWAEPFVSLRVPKIFNLRTDPFERADITSNTYYDWLIDRAFLVVPAQGIVAELSRDVPGVPPAPESGQLHHRSGHGQTHPRRRRRPLIETAGCRWTDQGEGGCTIGALVLGMLAQSSLLLSGLLVHWVRVPTKVVGVLAGFEFEGCTIQGVAVSVGNDVYMDLAKQAAAAMARD